MRSHDSLVRRMAKKKRKSSGLSGEEKQQRRQERLEARRLERLEHEARVRRAQRRERMVRYAMFLLLGLGIFWFLFLRGRGPSEINGHEVMSLSTVGTGDHTNNPVTYETSPPVSGAHAPGAAPCGTYAQEIPEETQVHMLEHGAIGVQYQPTLPADQIEQIEEIVASHDSHVFSAPYAASPTPISLTSWGRLMRLDEAEEDSIQQFIDAFIRKGPEGQDCPMDAEQHFEPGAEASPVPVETPVEGSPQDGAAEESPSG